MTPDLLDDLRRADPVNPEALELPPGLMERALAARPRRARRRLALALVPVAGVLLVALLARGGSPDLAERAYAAVSRPGIVHWRTELAGYANGRVGSRQRIEGWSLGGVAHVVHSDVRRGKPHVTVDSRTSGRRYRAWMSGSDDYSSGTLPRHRPAIEPIPSGDPLAAFRRAYRAGRLRDLGGGRFELRFPHIPAGSVIYQVDPATGRPLRLTVKGGPSTTIVRFTVYETLPVTAANRALLALLPHPDAGPGKEPASTYFAALRTGAPLSGPHAADVRQMARHMHFHVDVAGIRTLADGVWLLPGRGYVCLAVASDSGIGGTCQNTKIAAKRGLVIGGVAAAPDGVTAVEARERGNRVWQRYPVRDGIARLPRPFIGVRMRR